MARRCRDVLKVEAIDVFYGNIHALKGVSLEVNKGEIVTLIGANGAGKTTLLKTISGLLKPKSGDIVYEGASIAGKAAQTIVKQGISHVPEGRRVFANMTVEENLELGAFLRKDKDGIQQDFAKVFQLFPRLEERRKQLAGTLSGGEQQMLAIGRALMARPKLLLLDEPSMGLAPLLVKTIFRIIQEINESGTTILLVEQNAHMALSIADRAYVIESGRVVLSGAASELQASEQVKQAYLGGH
nr:ABC transporter ATP-binding protein [Geobacillus sp. DSP4a]